MTEAECFNYSGSSHAKGRRKMPAIWTVRPHDASRIVALERAAGVPAVVAQLLINRGVEDAAAADGFLHPKLSMLRDPEQLPGCREAAALIGQAIRGGKRIVVYGDYDADGVTGISILVNCLALLGADAGYYCPNRLEEGYGLNRHAVTRLAAEGTDLLVTVDCGITSVEEIRLAQQAGMEVVVTDHHLAGPQLPEAQVIVHPGIPGRGYPFSGLSGSGVAFKLAWALCRQAAGAHRVGPQMRDFLLQAVGLAALGTIADVVPLIDENRVLVKSGLESMARRPTPGIAALLSAAGAGPEGGIDSEFVAYQVAPRINAAGRLGEAGRAIELLTARCPDAAAALASQIEHLNKSRKELQGRLLQLADAEARTRIEQCGDAALVLAGDDWHPGLLGIVAGRLAEKHARPVVLVSWNRTDGESGSGSARSVAGVNLHAALEACREYLAGWGGHEAAGGLTIERRHWEGFRANFCEFVARQGSGASPATRHVIDAELPLHVLTPKVMSQIERLAPFGQENPRPVFLSSEVAFSDPPRAVGANGEHLRFKLAQHGTAMPAVFFSGSERLRELGDVPGPLDIIYSPLIKTFAGRSRVELNILDWRRARC